MDEIGILIEMVVKILGESFIMFSGVLFDFVSCVVEVEIGLVFEFFIIGGILDVWFIKNYCFVVEFGFVGKIMY